MKTHPKKPTFDEPLLSASQIGTQLLLANGRIDTLFGRLRNTSSTTLDLLETAKSALSAEMRARPEAKRLPVVLERLELIENLMLAIQRDFPSWADAGED